MAARGTKQPDAAAWAAALKHRPAYAKKLGDYFATFAVKERGVKKWIEKARADWIATGCPAGGPEFPPLDEPAKMLAWWQAHMSHTPSDIIFALAGVAPGDIAAAKKSPAGSSATAPSASSADQPAIAPATRPSINIADFAPMSFAEAVQRQGRYYAAAAAEYDQAALSGTATASELKLLADKRDRALDLLRTCQRDYDKAEIERGDRVHLSDLRDELAPLFSHLAASFIELLTGRVGLPSARARALADDWFAELRASRFTAAATPPVESVAPAA